MNSCVDVIERQPKAVERFGVVPTPVTSHLTIGTFAWMLTTDVCAHTWDVVRTIAANERLDEQLVVAQRIEQ